MILGRMQRQKLFLFNKLDNFLGNGNMEGQVKCLEMGKCSKSVCNSLKMQHITRRLCSSLVVRCCWRVLPSAPWRGHPHHLWLLLRAWSHISRNQKTERKIWEPNVGKHHHHLGSWSLHSAPSGPCERLPAPRAGRSPTETLQCLLGNYNIY